MVALHHWWTFLGHKCHLSFLTCMSGQYELKNRGEMKMPEEVVNIHLSLETSISQCVASSVRGSVEEIHLEMIEAITVGFSTLPMKHKHRSSQAKCPPADSSPRCFAIGEPLFLSFLTHMVHSRPLNRLKHWRLQ